MAEFWRIGWGWLSMVLSLAVLQACTGQVPQARQDLVPNPGLGRLVVYLHNTVYGSIDACKFIISVSNVPVGSVTGTSAVMIDVPAGTYSVGAVHDPEEKYCPHNVLGSVISTVAIGATSYVVVSDGPLRPAKLELPDANEAADIVSQHTRSLVDARQLGLFPASAPRPQAIAIAVATPSANTAQQAPGVSNNLSTGGRPPAQTSSIPSGVTSGQLLPVIATRELLQTSSDKVTLSGSITGNGKIASLKVDGSDAQYDSSGSFSFSRAVPIGDSNIKLIATDEWGQSAESSIRVTRNLSETVSAVLSPLNPGRMQVKANPKAVALIIGVERYKNAQPAEYADKDAQQFYDYAVHALGVPIDRIKLMIGPEAGNLDIEKALRAWVKPLVVKGQSDVFVFFAGHGLADGKDLFLFPYDGDRDLLDKSAIRQQELIQMAVDAGAKSATLFLDTCYSGGTRGKDTLLAGARPILLVAKQQDVPSNVTIFAAAGNDQSSSSLPQVQHGLFSYFLMKGMEGDAAGADHTITAAKLEAYLAEHVPSEAAKLGRTQTPQLIGDGERVISEW